MAKQAPLRSSYTTLAAAIVIAAVVISATIFANSTFSTTVTKTSTQTTSVTVNNLGNRVYHVTFQQVRDCGQFNIMPWAVTLNNIGITQVQPANQSLPLPTNTFSTIVPNQNLTKITFLVPSGTYNYTVSGGTPGFSLGGWLGPSTGAVKVIQSDVSVSVFVSLSITCTTTAAAP